MKKFILILLAASCICATCSPCRKDARKENKYMDHQYQKSLNKSGNRL